MCSGIFTRFTLNHMRWTPQKKTSFATKISLRDNNLSYQKHLMTGPPLWYTNTQTLTHSQSKSKWARKRKQLQKAAQRATKTVVCTFLHSFKLSFVFSVVLRLSLNFVLLLAMSSSRFNNERKWMFEKEKNDGAQNTIHMHTICERPIYIFVLLVLSIFYTDTMSLSMSHTLYWCSWPRNVNGFEFIDAVRILKCDGLAPIRVCERQALRSARTHEHKTHFSNMYRNDLNRNGGIIMPF